MKHAVGILTTLWIATTAFAAADLRVTVTSPSTADYGGTYTARAVVVNAGDAPATNTLFNLNVGMQVCNLESPLGTIGPGEQREQSCTVDVPREGYSFYVFAAAITPEEDLITADDNWSQREVGILLDRPDLVMLRPSVIPMATPGLPVKVAFAVTNYSNVPSSGATITVTAPGGFHRVPANCTANVNRAVCTFGPLAAREGARHELEMEIIAPDISQHRFKLEAQVQGIEEDHNPANDGLRSDGATYRAFFVTHGADSGSGSLRAAIEASNAECRDDWPCEIAFKIATESATPWKTIRVASPLPWITGANVVIDGETQTGFFGDTNPAGPEIEIKAAEGAVSGIEIATTCTAMLSGLAINGFPGNGVTIGGTVECQNPAFFVRAVERNYVGTDPTGTRAMGNGRGIVVNGPSRWTIQKNLVGGNHRSGIFIENGQTTVRYNTIGLDRTHLLPLGNGASGVAILPGGDGTDVSHNFIAFNRHFGIGIVAGTENIGIDGNSIQANDQRGIDWGLDGLVPATPVPEITSVRYENGQTIIEGTLTPGVVHATWSHVNVYANDAPDPSGYGEGQYALGAAQLTGRRFVFISPLDLRGKWIAATVTHTQYYGWVRTEGREYWFTTTTSEFGRAVEVR